MFKDPALNIIYILPCILSIIYISTISCEEYTQSVKITVTPVKVGLNSTIVCIYNAPDVTPTWEFNGVNISDNERYNFLQEIEENSITSSLHIHNITHADSGNYTCTVAIDDQVLRKHATLDVYSPIVTVSKSNKLKSNVDGEHMLYCLFEGFPFGKFYWLRGNDSTTISLLKEKSNITYVNNATRANLTLHLGAISRKDNGSYYCIAEDAFGHIHNDSVIVLVLEKPQVSIDFVKAVGADKIYMNWTLNDGNDPVIEYFVQYMEEGTGSYTFYNEKIHGGNYSFVLKNLKPNTEYKLQMAASNKLGIGQYHKYAHLVRTLKKDPNFIPKIEVKGNTFNTITIGWTAPPTELLEHIHYYELLAQEYNSTDKKEVLQPEDSRNLPYMFAELKTATMYYFKARACSDYTHLCGNWSEIVNGTTMDGLSGPPQNVTVICHFDNISHLTFVNVSWGPPLNKNGKITHYNVILEGHATYKTNRGLQTNETLTPKMKSIADTSYNARFDMIPANTNYTVHVAGVTRTKKPGEKTTKTCTMPPTIPNKDDFLRLSWGKVEEHGNWMFKLDLPRVSERNGRICCYRIFIIRMVNHQTISDLPRPEDLSISTYEAVHKNPSGGVYVAEMFTSDMLNNEVFLGDGRTVNSSVAACQQCIGLKQKRINSIPSLTIKDTKDVPAIIPSLAAVPTLNFTATAVPAMEMDKKTLKLLSRRRRDLGPEQLHPPIIFDGQLDSQSNYSGFVEIMVYGSKPGLVIPAYSDYFVLLNPGPEFPFAPGAFDILGVVIQLFCGLILVVLFLLLSLCLLHRYTKQVAQAQGVEMMTLRNSFRHLCRSLRGRHQLVSLSPPDMVPIQKDDLLNAYMERHKDSDYGFQHEFELLPDRFPDRTTRASEARENLYKNRYPDIKAYDQTRVKLAQIDSVTGSDYINANFVMGYKERKKFICAQGPMENTVNDFWRMIWEQHLELILMLTNLEEYSKTKCAKYWPEKTDGDKIYGDITVAHIQETRYSDYIVRELKVSRNISGREVDERNIFQYHFLVWKDFMAPEHPHGILKFIKRMNEAYSFEHGPILIHCSAGVGRTGTLVALDNLLQQLKEEGQVAIFNTVCDMRHQRNFLVQSLKQYIFVYRTLMEVGQYGDTEIPANKLKSTIDKLRSKENDKDRCKLDEEFDKFKMIMEDRKPYSVGIGEENIMKNRSEEIIPYDRNRVILTPICGREHSTYINASFIEGYDNTESFIVTQDPLDDTIADFWRMISEQGISTLVMLADLGEGPRKCPRYWPDDEILHDHIRVKYVQSESCPYHTRREIIVTNTKYDNCVKLCLNLDLPKFGTCPASRESLLDTPCVKSCTLDSQCFGISMCCTHHCGSICRQPIGLSQIQFLPNIPTNITVHKKGSKNITIWKGIISAPNSLKTDWENGKHERGPNGEG
ncbi:tyrosine-protein phosphatase 69D-like [Ctenocephalides felis]|uniref:tyrosine-protein phosphatase 69D-like n=1 Tax=Ctenocephalides felis TaxID=7515 RepID=UPI000E6E267E|nr:tyrosine-protein phosphatase 69D-like [Ctenocephalides felis]